jgi:hypothetical protein
VDIAQPKLRRRTMKRLTKRLALCLENEGNEASLIPGKVYQVILDAPAAKDDLMRTIDESGEDYLFCRAQFAPVVRVVRGRDETGTE